MVVEATQVQEGVVGADDGQPQEGVHFVAAHRLLVDDVLVEDELGSRRHLLREITSDAHVADAAVDCIAFFKKEEAGQREEEKHDLAFRLCVSLGLFFLAGGGYVKTLAVVIVLT